MPHNYLTLPITPELSGLRIYRILRDRLSFSAEKIRSVKFDPAGIFLNGCRVTVNASVSPGDTLRILLDDSGNREDHILPNPGELRILYEDKNLLAVDKPAGTVCHPSRGHLTDSLANYVRAYFDETDEFANIHFIGRLDKETSGVVLIAKNGVYAEALQQGKISEDFTKIYIALAEGRFEEKAGKLTLPMEEYRDPSTGILRMIPGGKAGKSAETVYETIEEKDGYTLLRVTIRTGRMHQIRFHMSAAGHPLLSDPLYGKGDRDPRIGRTALHAETLIFRDPLNGEKRVISAPVPEDMAELF